MRRRVHPFLMPPICLVLLFIPLSACTPPPTTRSATGAATAAPATVPTATAQRTAIPTPAATAAPATLPARYQDATYEIEGKAVRLTNGLSEVEAAPGSASRVVTRIFGNEARGDLNGDGATDVGFVLTQSSGGSGTFYYAAAALQTTEGWIGTNAVLLGDRIAPQTTQLEGGVLIVNYAERRPGEPMTERVSIGVSKYLRVVGGRLAPSDQPR